MNHVRSNLQRKFPQPRVAQKKAKHKHISTQPEVMYALHKYLKPGSKLTQFKKNISALSVDSSYYILIFMMPQFKDQ